MASHYVSASSDTIVVKLYKNTNTISQVIEILPQNSQIIVLDEYIGRNCEYHFVSSSTNSGYLLNQYIYPLSGTAESAPYVCGVQPNPAYVEPTWYYESEPFINDKTNEYCVCVTSDFLTPSEVDENEILKKGIKSLLRYYNKLGSYDDTIIEKYLNYYIFAKIKENYVPFRPLMRVKYLVAIPVKYFDAIEDDKMATSIAPLERDYSDVDFVLKIDLKESRKKFNSLSSLLRLYGADLFSSNSTLVFNTSTLFGNEDIIQNPAVDEMDFAGKADNVDDFSNKLENLITLNGYDYSPAFNMIDDVNIQFAINSECNIIYDVSIEVNGQCRKLRKGIESFLKSEPVTDPTTINFVKKIHNINKIDKCKVPWYNFAEQYVYPPVDVQAQVIDEDAPSYEQFKKLFDLFVSFQNRTSQQPVKTLQQLYEEEVEKSTQDLNYLVVSTPLMRFLFQGDNELDPTNLDKVFKKIEKSVSGQNANKDVYAIKQNGEFTEVNISTKQKGDISIVDKSTFRLYTEEPRIVFDGVEYTIYFSSKTSQDALEAKQAGDAMLNRLRELQDFLNKIGICKLVDLAWGCLTALLRTLGVNIEQSIEIAVLKNFKYDQIINDIIPYLPAEQQQFLYEQLLLELGCINKSALLNLLKNYLSSEQISISNIDSSGATYEDVVSTVASKMVITTVSE